MGRRVSALRCRASWARGTLGVWAVLARGAPGPLQARSPEGLAALWLAVAVRAVLVPRVAAVDGLTGRACPAVGALRLTGRLPADGGCGRERGSRLSRSCCSALLLEARSRHRLGELGVPRGSGRGRSLWQRVSLSVSVVSAPVRRSRAPRAPSGLVSPRTSQAARALDLGHPQRCAGRWGVFVGAYLLSTIGRTDLQANWVAAKISV